LAQAKADDKVRFVSCNDAEAVAALMTEKKCYEKAHCVAVENQRACLSGANKCITNYYNEWGLSHVID
jgi:hypothetical protein